MCEFRDIGETEGPAAPLDGMRRTKDAVDLFRVDLSRVHVQQTVFHHVQSLEALFEEHLMELRHIDTHTGLRALEGDMYGFS